MSGEVTPGNLNIGTWLDKMHQHTEPIYSKLQGSSNSLYSIFDSKIGTILDKCIASPGTTVGDANLSGDTSIMRDFSHKMDSATKKANEELDALYKQLDEETLAKNKEKPLYGLFSEDIASNSQNKNNNKKLQEQSIFSV